MALPSVPLALAGAAVAILVAFAARGAGALTTSGALAAAVAGAMSVAAGWEWGVLLMVFFLTSTALSRAGAATKIASSGGRASKTGPRDAWQVAANGGAFAACAILAAVTEDSRMALAALGAIATANGDTWATELGVLFGGTPRSIVSFRSVPRGTSGGISLAGTAAGVLGVAVIAFAAMLLDIHQGAFGAILTGGMAGLILDSLLGATMQSQRWCAQCRELTERRVHPCGTATMHARGVTWINNDGVNALATIAGALVAVSLG